MKLTATHTTTYLYSAPVSICHTEVHLKPRHRPEQALLAHELSIQPPPDCSLGRRDYFGNEVTYFSIHQQHLTLTVKSRSLVDLLPEDPIQPGLTPPWEQVREQIRQHRSAEDLDAFQFTFESPRVTLGSPFAAYAERSFAPRRPLLQAVMDLCERIHSDFKYDQEATTVTTPVDEVLESRHGVCQDFAHVMIACLRSLELPARYVSGYLRSSNSVGGEASHAWVSAFCPGFGWLDFDPTNNVMGSGEQLTLAWGRDYSDVTPVKGVALGSGDQVVNVSVEVRPAETLS
jgi:transglutaminase-like putative cysteine protease